MKKLLLVTGALALAAMGTASAADLAPSPMYSKAPPVAAPAPTWTGCYVDGGIGYGMWNQDVSLTGNLLSTTVPPTVIGTVNSVTTTDGGRGWLGRVGVGCDYQFAPQFVVGAFGDFDFMSLKGTNLPNELVVFANGATSPAAYNVKATDAWYAGLRLGYLPYPNLLTFVSAGWTQIRFENSGEYVTTTGAAIPGLTYNSAYTPSGWFIGGGTEYRIPWAPSLTWKTEYRFAEYRSTDLTETSFGVATGNIEHNQSFVQTVTTSLVWRFNFGGPVVARY